jgi:hypothetical protein
MLGPEEPAGRTRLLCAAVVLFATHTWAVFALPPFT